MALREKRGQGSYASSQTRSTLKQPLEWVPGDSLLCPELPSESFLLFVLSFGGSRWRSHPLDRAEGLGVTAALWP